VGLFFGLEARTLSVRSFYLCPFHWKLRPSGVSLESPRLKNIPKLPANQAKVSQNHDARKAVSATLSVLKWSGATFRSRGSIPSACFFHLCLFYWKLRPSGSSVKSPELENIPQGPANWAKVVQNKNARKAVSTTFSVLKWSGAIFRPRNLTLNLRPIYLCPCHWKLRPSGVILESPGLENVPQVSANRAKVALDHDGRKAVLATLSVLKWSGSILRPRTSTPSVRSLYLCPFHPKLRPSGVSLESPRLKNIPEVRANQAKLDQNHQALKAASATPSVSKCSGAIFRPRRSTPCVQSFYLCPFHWKLRPSIVSLEFLGAESIPQVPANRAKVAQNHNARKAVSAIFSVLKWWGPIFRPRSSTPSMRSFYLYPIHWKLRRWGVILESPTLENIPQVLANRAIFA